MPPIGRSACTALIALLLAFRLLSPAGLMPAFDHGAVTIVACPDFGPTASAPAHHQHGKKFNPPCPYAAASAPGAMGTASPAQAAAFTADPAPLPVRAFRFLQHGRDRDRPPSRGPPVPA